MTTTTSSKNISLVPGRQYAMSGLSQKPCLVTVEEAEGKIALLSNEDMPGHVAVGQYSDDGPWQLLGSAHVAEPAIVTFVLMPYEAVVVSPAGEYFTVQVLPSTSPASNDIVRFPIGGVEVYGPRDRFGETLPSQITWSSLGAVTQEAARQFTEALAAAHAIAQNLDQGILP